ncbi:hypothetical protein ONR75_18560 [Rhodopseudomonas sp. P2A-2r]|uniref:hypothetical protein n=1 Tax=Rhodopseudomonas sp. P2A-2r TaxID=2991972 RepID=UPI0022340B40|nr:hypothetical protein [Rhodopseudomonas sp. P2A-2r]UZE47007.1 hypothetical protein ONR75_18560 [Rhodopseudomonas sp. P2A-2r]
MISREIPVWQRRIVRRFSRPCRYSEAGMELRLKELQIMLFTLLMGGAAVIADAIINT